MISCGKQTGRGCSNKPVAADKVMRIGCFSSYNKNPTDLTTSQPLNLFLSL